MLERLEAKMNRKITLNNDADAAGWAEHRFGAARGEELSVCLTLGTGIGGAIIFDNRILRGSFGVAGEFGHQTLVVEGIVAPVATVGVGSNMPQVTRWDAKPQSLSGSILPERIIFVRPAPRTQRWSRARW